MQSFRLDDRLFRLEADTCLTTSRENLDRDAARLFELFVQREKEFGFNPAVVVEYPDISDPPMSPFLMDPVSHIASRREASGRNGEAISRVVVLTTYGDRLLEPLGAAGYEASVIDMPAGPDHTYCFIRDDSEVSKPPRTLYLEAVNEADEKIRPSFVIRLLDEKAELVGGACGAIHARSGKRYAYLATMTLVQGLPATTGTKLAEALLDFLRAQGVQAVHLGTQTAGSFYERLGFRVTHTLVEGLRNRQRPDGSPVRQDLVMMAMDLS